MSKRLVFTSFGLVALAKAKSLFDDPFFLHRSIVLATLLVSPLVLCSTEVQSSKIGDYTFFYSELADGTVCIENSDAFRAAKDKKNASAAVMPKPAGKIEIPATINGKIVSAIGPAALFLSGELREVVLPQTIKSIGAGAFSHCFKLEHIRLPKSCVNIGDGAFYGCTALESICVPLGVTHIGESTFVMCESLKSIAIPVSVTNIGYMAFMGCKSLKELRLPPKLSYLGGGAFSLCTSLVDVRIPASVENLEPCIFQGCSNLVSVTIQRKYDSPAGSFRDCPRLEKVYGLENFAEIDIDDFWGAKLVENIKPENGLLMVDGWVLGFEPTKSGEYVIPSGVKLVNHIFTKLPQPSDVHINRDCPYVSRMIFPDLKGAFEDCTNLVSVTIEKAIGKECNAFSFPNSAFKNCKNLKTVVVKDRVRSLSGNVFEGCDSLEYFTLPSIPMTSHRLWTTAIPKKFRIKLYSESLDNAQVACMYIIDTVDSMVYNEGAFDQEKFETALSFVMKFMERHPDKHEKDMKYCIEVFEGIAIYLDGLVGVFKKNVDRSKLPSRKDVYMYQLMMYRALALYYHDAYAYSRLGEWAESIDKETEAVEYYKMAARAYAEQEIEKLEKRTGKYKGDSHIGYTRKCMMESIDKIRKLGFAKTAELLLSELDAKIEGGRVADKPQRIVTGTGWAVSPSHIVTCWHVVKGAKKISCVLSDGSALGLTLVAADKANDIAIFKIAGDRELGEFLPLRVKPMKISEPVFTIGYPLTSILGQSQKYTEGTVSAVAGIDNDVRFYQISVPIQPGNSGGALVNSNGEVVGLTSSGLDALVAVGVTGAIPQNVNYAVKARYVAAVLDDNDIQYRTASPKGTSKEQAVSIVEKATVLIKAE